MSVLFRNARLLELDDGGTLFAPTDMLVQGARISAVGPPLQPITAAPGARAAQ
jgi:hypothetical protein